MYSTCLFCNQSLGSNEAIEAFPVGRRLAFDQRKGRLWVVCRKCEKWNLTPLEERWEAIETCERLFRDTRKRLSTDNIGLAKLSEGLDLVRIGEPQRPEFAAWRYGDQFGRRRRRKNLFLAGSAILSVSYVFTSWTAATGVGGLTIATLRMAEVFGSIYRNRRVVVRIPDETGAEFIVRRKDVGNTRLLPGESTAKWLLQLRRGIDGRKGQVTLSGPEARRIAARVVPHVNEFGSTPKQTAAAVKHLEEAGDPERFLAWAARNRKWRHGAEVWLGIEMAVNEENERIALESELALLEDAWKEAEEIAAIADRLTLPREVEENLAKLKVPN